MQNVIPEGARFVPVYRACPIPEGLRGIDLLHAVEERSPGAPIFYLQRAKAQGDELKVEEVLVAFDPFETLRFSRGQVEIQGLAGRSVQQGDPFRIVADRLLHYRLPERTELDSFFGGVLGYFAYDAVRFLEPRLAQAKADSPCGNLARLTDSPTASRDGEFMFFRKRIVLDLIQNRVLLGSGFVPTANASENASLQARCEKELTELEALLSAIRPRSPIPLPASLPEIAPETMRPMLGKESFLAGVRKIKAHIMSGDIFQAVLSEQFRTPFVGSPRELFEILSRINPSPYEFYFATGERVLLGASPEMLLKNDRGELQTHPIAGTRPRGRNVEEELKLERQLLRSVKEKAEHLMLVDLARNDIGRVSETGQVQVETFMKLKKFGAVMHLVSCVKGRLKRDTSSLEALAACFPAGTLSGAPKVRAMEILSEIEPEARGFYGGALLAGSLNGDLDSCIAIRSVRIEKGVATVQAGAGIVADSQPEKEYAEVLHKTRMVRRALALLLGDPA